MGRKLPAVVARTAPLTLTGTPAVVLGTNPGDAADPTTGAIALRQLSMVRVWGLYERAALGTTGTPRFALDVSMDPPSTDPDKVARWVPVFMLDGGSFAAGAIDAWPEVVAAQPTDAGPVTRGSPPWDVRAAQWARISVADADATHPGTLEAVSLAGET